MLSKLKEVMGRGVRIVKGRTFEERKIGRELEEENIIMNNMWCILEVSAVENSFEKEEMDESEGRYEVKEEVVRKKKQKKQKKKKRGSLWSVGEKNMKERKEWKGLRRDVEEERYNEGMDKDEHKDDNVKKKGSVEEC